MAAMALTSEENVKMIPAANATKGGQLANAPRARPVIGQDRLPNLANRYDALSPATTMEGRRDSISKLPN